jgi:DNA-binding Xre family transcriptional regulator
MNVNDRIRHYIESNDMTFGLVAARANIDDSKFSRMMTNKQRIKVDEYERICDALCVPHSYFFQKKFLETRNQTA